MSRDVGYLVEAGATKKNAKGTASGVTPAQLKEAERGLPLMLAKKFSAVWIAKNAKDLLSHVNIEYAEWLEDNPPARNPVGWLLNGAYWRALNLLDSERRKPPESSLDAVFHLADESTPDPEQETLDKERKQRLAEALSHLPEKECKLLALVYYEDMSIREAGRKLGWRKSAADRHHRSAMEKLLALVGDRSLLTPALLGPLAWAAVNGEGQRALAAIWEAALGPARKAMALCSEIVEIGTHRLADWGRRISPFTEAGNAAATGGGGRILGYCGAAAGAVVCGLLGSGAVGPGVDVLSPTVPRAAKSRPAAHQLPASSPSSVATPKLSTPDLALPKRSVHPEAATTTKAAQPIRRRARNPLYRSPIASGQQSQSEFGDANFEPGPAEGSSPADTPAESSPSPVPTPSSSSQSSGSSAASEFGL